MKQTNDYVMDLMHAFEVVNHARKDPEKMEQLISQAIETEDKNLFRIIYGVLEHSKINLTCVDAWQKLIESGNTDFLQKIVIAPETNIQSVRDLQHAFVQYTKQNNVKRAFFQTVSFIIQDARALAYAQNLNNDDINVIFINRDAPAGDFPDIIINTEDVAFRFCGLTKKQIEGKGTAEHLKELFQEYEERYFARAEVYKKEATKAPSETSTTNLDVLSSAEVVHFYYKDKKPSEYVTDTEFQKANQLASLCLGFFKTPAAPLLDFFVQQGKALAINKTEFSELKGLCTESAIAVDNINNISTLHHELIHNADRALHFTQTPVFKALCEYCNGQALFYPMKEDPEEVQFWKAMEIRYHNYQKPSHVIETPAFMASISYEVSPQRLHIENVLNFINAYVKNHISGNQKEENRLAKALQNTSAADAKYEPIQYLGRVIQARQQANLMKRNQTQRN